MTFCCSATITEWRWLREDWFQGGSERNGYCGMVLVYMLTVPTDKGLHVSRMTANKVRQIAEQRGFITEQKYN